VPGGVRLLYLGWGAKQLRGPATGLVYRVSERYRDFTVHRDDATALLSRTVILAP